MIRQSTPEEIEVRRAEIKAAECSGDGIHTTDMRFWHDWRLWKRSPILGEESQGQWPVVGHNEMWYCTRCRKIEERQT